MAAAEACKTSSTLFYREAMSVFSSVFLSLLTAACLLGQAPKRLYVFGDSYSDTGAGYVDGNGPTAVAYLAERLGFKLALPSDPDAASKSLNFSVSGAQTGRGEGHPVKDALLGRGMVNQVDQFVQLVRSKAIAFNPDQTLFF